MLEYYTRNMVDLNRIKSQKSVSELLEFGIINIDKPSGPTSFDVSEFIRKTLGLRKTSHFGTLDPKVSGVLPIALNRACKLTGFFLGEDKEYVGIMRLHKEFPIEELKKIVREKFLGKIMQKPPVKSRVARVLREREIKNFDIIEKEEKDFLFRIEVQGGTYIRKIVHDLGETIGIGAHMLELRRTKAGIFKEKDSFSLYDFETAVEEYNKGNDSELKRIIYPGEIISELFPIVQVKEESAEKILRGRPVYKKNLASETQISTRFNRGDKVCIFSKDRFIGVFTVLLQDKIFAKPEFVLQPIK